ncbi:MAG: substrate binding domain-containing protein [Pseudomonadota bacterium]
METPKGLLRVSASTAFGEKILVPLIKPFQARYPDIELSLTLSDAQVDLIASGIDLAVRLAPDAPPETIVSRLTTTHYRVVASPSYIAANPLSEPMELSKRQCLRFPYAGFRDLWRARDADGTIVDIPIAGAVEISGAMALRAAALEGLGPALLADWLIADDIVSGAFVDPFPKFEWAATRFDTGAWLLFPSRAFLPAKTRVFIELLREWALRQR